MQYHHDERGFWFEMSPSPPFWKLQFNLIVSFKNLAFETPFLLTWKYFQ